MAGFKVKEEKQKSSGGIDWERFNEQLEEYVDDSYYARICAVVDLGRHDQGEGIDTGGVTYFETEEAAFDVVDEIEKKFGAEYVEENNIDQFEDIDEVYVLPFKIVKDKWVFPRNEDNPDNVMYAHSEDESDKLVAKAKKLDTYKNIKNFEPTIMEDCIKANFRVYQAGIRHEVGILADIPEIQINYVEGQPDRALRVDLARNSKEGLQGLTLSFDKDTGALKDTSNVHKLVKTCRAGSILDPKSDDFNDLSLLLNKSFLQPIDKTKNGNIKYSTTRGQIRTKDLENVPPLEIKGYEEGVCITMDFDESVEEMVNKLDAIFLKKSYVDKIKAAEEYGESKLRKAIELWEKRKEERVEEDKAEETETETTTDKVTEKPKPEKAAEAKPEKPKRRTQTKKAVVEEDEEVEPKVVTEPPKAAEESDGDDDIPWD